MIAEFSSDYLLDKKIKIFQPLNGYRASTDAVLLAAMVADNLNKAKILDVGSGTGAVSLCLAQRLQARQVEITGIEIQKELAELANFSALQNDFKFLHYLNLDIREKIGSQYLAPCSFDMVVTNPPYSDHDMPSPNKSKALAHNHSNFNLTQWLHFCLKMTKPFGKIYLVNRVEALPEICNALQGKAGGICILPIYSKENQLAKRIIVTAQKDAKAPCRFLPPFYTHRADGQYTDAANKVLREGFCLRDVINF